MAESNSLKKFQKELKVLFRSEDKDFNWGIYRIMNQKNAEITQFIDKKIPEIVEEKIKGLRSDFGSELEENLKDLEKNLLDAGVDPKTSPKYQDLLKKKKEGRSLTDFEDSIYNHLIEFFSRYYQDGDFINQFYFKDDQYLIPYDGSETMLHWATKDMYYVKSSDQYQRFSFKTPDEKKMVTFKVSVKEEEKGNKKGTNKYFVIDEVEWDENELVCSFKNIFETDEISTLGNNKTERQDELNKEIAQNISEKLGDHVKGLDFEKNLLKFQKRYVEDFFIHKDLKGFLEKQMNFYINQEIVHIDSFINDDGNFNDDLKIMAKVFKDICKNVIEKLALLENMKKKIWEKKKFVLETNFVITLDKIQEYCGNDFLANIIEDILSNQKQIDEWKQLFNFNINSNKDLIENKTYDDNYKYKKLPVDTKCFNDDFKWNLINNIDNLDDKLDNLSIHSENYQALNLILNKYKNNVKCVYIDPPYNTGRDEFIYKDCYRHSSWSSMMSDRIELGSNFIDKTGAFYVSIDDREQRILSLIMNDIFEEDNFLAQLVWEKVHTRKNSANYYSIQHEYILSYAKNKETWKRSLIERQDTSAYKNPDNDPRGDWKPDPITAHNPYSATYKITKPNGTVLSKPKDRYWAFSEESWNKFVEEDRVLWGKGDSYPMIKRYLSEVQDGLVPVSLFKREDIYETTVLNRGDFGDTKLSKADLVSLFNDTFGFEYTKPVKLMKQLLCVSAGESNNIVLDFFSGTGSTVHGLIELENEKKKNRKTISIEMGDHFNYVLIPRIKKVLYSLKWENGKPKEINGSGGFFKYQELEQYEDSLENIILKQSTLEMFNENLDILLRYQLEEGIDENKSKNFLGVDTEKQFLNLSINVVGKDGATNQQKVDLIETFNYLIGIEINKMKKINENNRDYYIITGKTDDYKTIVIWRDPKDLDKEKDRDFITKQLEEDTFKNIYVNSDCHIQGYKNIYDEMRKRLW